MKFLSSISSSSHGRAKARLAFRGLLFLALICPSQMMVDSLLFQEAAPAVWPNLTKIAEENPDILVVGDSTLSWDVPSDTDSRTIHEMVQDRVPGMTVESVCAHANIPHVEVAMLKHLKRMGAAPSCVVLCFNLGGVGPIQRPRALNWYDRQVFELTHDSALLRIFYRPVSVFSVEDDPPGTRNGSDKLDFADRLGFDIRDCPKIIDNVMKCEKLVRQMGSELFVYATPVDLDAIENGNAPEIADAVRSNIGVLRESLEEKGIKLLDLSGAVPHEEFFYEPHAPNEHLKQEGRRIVAEAIAKTIHGMKRISSSRLRSP